MSITATKASPTPTGVGYAQIDSTQRSVESEKDTDVKVLDNKKNVKGGLHGIAEKASSTWSRVTADLPFDKLSPAESIKRDAHSSREVERSSRPHITEAQASSAREEERKASGKEFIARAAAIERPSGKKDPRAGDLGPHRAMDRKPDTTLKMCRELEKLLDQDARALEKFRASQGVSYLYVGSSSSEGERPVD